MYYTILSALPFGNPNSDKALSVGSLLRGRFHKTKMRDWGVKKEK